MTKILSDAQAAEIRERAERATPEPWRARGWPAEQAEVVCDEKTPIASWQGFDDSDRSTAQHRRNARFIAHSRTDVPRLLDSLAECKRLLGSVYPYIQHHWEIPAALFEEVKAVVK